MRQKHIAVLAGLCFALLPVLGKAQSGKDTFRTEIKVMSGNGQDSVIFDESTLKVVRGLGKTVDSLNRALKDRGMGENRVYLRVDSTSDRKKFRLDDNMVTFNIGGGEKKKEKSKRKKRRNIRTDFLNLDLGINTYLFNNDINLPARLEALELNHAKSTNVALHIVQQGVNLYRHKLFFTYAVSLDWMNYKFRNPYTLTSRADSLMPIGETIKFDKNKLTANYLTVPVMLHFQSRPFRRSRSFNIAAGGFAGILVDSYTKQVSDERGKVKFHDDYNLNQLRYGLSARLGFSYLNFYANYSLSPLFQKGQGPDMQPLQFGIVAKGFHW